MQNKEFAPASFSRSTINQSIELAIDVFSKAGFQMPPFAFWTPEQWRTAGPEYDDAREARLGWDVTDFGQGDFLHIGRVLFTLRNGKATPDSKPYAEKIILGRHGQRAPAHYHINKIEDIINRGCGELVLSLAPQPGKQTAVVYCDGREMVLATRTEVRLSPGESICLPPGTVHQFWGEDTTPSQPTLIGEVSSFCDDVNDNVFLDPVARFANIVEDEPSRHILCHEIPAATAK
jgi:D-lyxose ketol-isomerase